MLYEGVGVPLVPLPSLVPSWTVLVMVYPTGVLGVLGVLGTRGIRGFRGTRGTRGTGGTTY